MNYILKEQFLPLGYPQQTNYQYYNWVEKRRVEQEQAQQESWKKRWSQIQQQEKQNRKSKARPTSDRHCSNCDSSMQMVLKSQLTYVKNMMWKQNLEQKMNKMRLEHQEEIEREELKHLVSQPKAKPMYREAQHKGPIKAWEERFQAYLRNRQEPSEEQQASFRPRINPTSRRITRNMVGRVENRLITYGQKLKEKKAELEIQYEEQLFNGRNRCQNASIESYLSDCFYRLYKDGEKQHQKRNDQKSLYSFTPEINQQSIEIVSRITSKRKPLYESKVNRTESNVSPNKGKEQKKKGKRQGSFSDFLKRNEALLNKQELNRYKKEEEDREKENRDAKTCTFTPEINANSKKIVKNKPIQQSQINSRVLGLQMANQIPFLLNNNESQDEYQCLACDQNLTSKEKSYRLSYDGILFPTNKIEISQLESVANDLLNSEEERSVSTQKANWRRNVNVSKELSSEMFATDRGNQPSDIITEEMEEDSIEKEKEELWENQLGMMEQQIEAMMKRANN